MARGPTVGVFTRSGRISRGKARFANEVSDWVKATEKRLNAVFRLSTQRVIEVMQKTDREGGYLPYDQGFLRASLVVLVNKPPPPADKTDETASPTYNPDEIQLAIAGAVAGDRIVAAYTMAYARRLEYGFVGTDSLGRSYNQQGIGWTQRAAQQWPQIVKAVEQEAMDRVAGRQ
ncbi:hypothetical protein [Rhizobium sp. 2MFCol3.1]|uniref:hypothetical protein n=1 Tax=Rhizobium sp. 2MFCol3.1 TaxID=1246459 RepID=UPI000360BA65|nr:hypothetical protein [Rhizobium sp. 2MFCol3.1]